MTDETIGGMPVGDGQIEALSAEAERGYPLERLRRRGRRPIADEPGVVVPVRMDPALLAALQERAGRNRLSRSEAIRAAVRVWLGGGADVDLGATAAGTGDSRP